MPKLLICSLAIFFFLSSWSFVSALNFEESGNAAGSQNSVKFQTDNQIENSQSNSLNYQTNVSATADSGGNSMSGNTGGFGTIVTGDSGIKIKIVNQGNNNLGGVGGCCQTPTPTSDPKASPATFPENGTGSIATVNDPGGPADPGSSNSPQILGLSNTAGENKAEVAIYLVGFLCLGLAFFSSSLG